MLFYCLNNGQLEELPPVPPDVVLDRYLPLLQDGGHAIDELLFEVESKLSRDYVTIGVYSTKRTRRMPRRPVSIITIVFTDAAADEAWPSLEKAYLAITDVKGLRDAGYKSPRRPDHAPWLAYVSIFTDEREFQRVVGIGLAVTKLLAEERESRE